MAASAMFMHVEFVDDIGKIRSIDFVPASWISFDEGKQHLVTRFPSDVSKPTLKIVKELVKSGAEPLSSWPMHRISIRGSAKTYAEAVIKVKALERKDYAFTTDNEKHVADRQQNILKSYKIKGQKYDQQEVKDLFAAAALNVPIDHSKKGASHGKKNNDTMTCGKKFGPRSLKKKKPGKRSTYRKIRDLSDTSDSDVGRTVISSGNDRSKNSSDSNSDTNNHSNVPSAATTKRNSLYAIQKETNKDCSAPPRTSFASEKSPALLDVNDSNNNCNVPSSAAKKQNSLYVSEKKTDEDCSAPPRTTSAREKSPSGLVDVNDTNDNWNLPNATTKKQNSLYVSEKKTNKGSSPRTAFTRENEGLLPGLSDINDAEVKSLIVQGFNALSRQIGQIQSQLSAIKLGLSETSAVQKKMKGIDAIVEKENFSELPFTTLKEFMKFDEKLRTDKTFKKAIIHGMSTLIHPNPKLLGQSVRDVIKKIMIRDVLLNFTSVKKSGTKLVFKDDTAFYICVRDAIFIEFHAESAGVKEKAISDAFGAVINNAKDWGGRARKRDENE